MPTLVEWRVTDVGWVQVSVDADPDGNAVSLIGNFRVEY